MAMSEERHEQKSAMVASVPMASLWMLLICLCLVIFDAVFDGSGQRVPLVAHE